MGEGEIGRWGDLKDKETGRRGDKRNQNPKPRTRNSKPKTNNQKPLVSGKRSDNEKDQRPKTRPGTKIQPCRKSLSINRPLKETPYYLCGNN
jgi:hypothetical protein